MAKSKPARMKRAGHVRVLCPHCNRSVNVQRPQGLQRSVPCPNCRIPIPLEEITSAEAAAEPTAESSDKSDSEATKS